ncbi:uncharacterized protein LOC133791649 [Humulus lupulus]|uniref:uncharacterized protein LOC133791649 n=1 Tax=Humulus lupulus TaxID=3486 RepID=UPI002B401228|nr:uncharacterized protein LOC133791649 [Humulus lupulus]
MKQQTYKKRKDIHFKLGDLVLIKLQPSRQTTVVNRLNSKLCRRYFGPFQVIDRTCPVAYALKLPLGSRIHPTFHVSLLKPYHGATPLQYFPLPELSVANHPLMTPLAILATRIQLKNNKKVRQILVQWTLSSLEDATWEYFSTFIKLYDLANLEDKVVYGEGSSVTPAQPDSPIPLDPDVIEHQDLVTTQPMMESQPKETIANHEEGKNEGDTSNRKVRVKPFWLMDFVMLLES